MKSKVVAMMYDFDKTLCTKDMQEFSFIPEYLGMDAKEFWKEVITFTNQEDMDPILAYLRVMIEKSEELNKPIKRDELVKMGKSIEFFAGVETWFERMNQYAGALGIELEHYVISSGLTEIVEGTSVYSHFKRVYACEFLYNREGNAYWPKLAVNYTAKTQFLFRINKGVLDIANDRDVNSYLKEEDRRVPFENMIYIGDGITDVPCMKLVKEYGGHSIVVYDGEQSEIAAQLYQDGRVNFMMEANYVENGQAEELCKSILRLISARNTVEGYR